MPARKSDYTPTSRKDEDGHKVYTLSSKDYVWRKKKDGKFAMRPVAPPSMTGGDVVNLQMGITSLA